MKEAIQHRKIHVVQLVLSLAPGGMEQVVKVLSLGLDPERFVVSVFCLLDEGPLAGPIKEHGISVQMVRPGKGIGSTLWPAYLRDALAAEEPDVIHSHSGCWFAAVRAARMAGVPVCVHTEHGRFSPDKWRVILLDRLAMPKTDCLVCVSDDLFQYMTQKVGAPPTRTQVIRNGIEVDRYLPYWNRQGFSLRKRYSIPDEAFLLVTVGRLAPVKGHCYLLDAVKLLQQEGRHIRLWILGDGPLRDETTLAIKHAGLEEVVSLVGNVVNVSDYLMESDVFVLPSLSEGTSMALLEAMAVALPSVATSVGGNPTVLGEGVGGLLVPAASPQAIAIAVNRLCDDESLRLRLGQEARAIVQGHYSSQNMVNEYQDLYRKLLSNKGVDFHEQ